MPCSRFRCSGDNASMDTLPAPTSASDVEEWWQIRRKNLRYMRKQTRMILFFMAAMEAMRIGPVQLVYAGRQGFPAAGPEDFGLAYSVSYFLSWLYVCAFMIVWIPLFSWWVPKSDPATVEDSKLAKFADVLKRLNMILLPFAICLTLLQHAFFTIHTLIYVDARPKGSRKFPKNTRKNWIVRLLMVSGMVWTVLFGNFALDILETMDLAHVKQTEYYVVLLPIFVNFGLFFGTIGQWRMEKRIARREASINATATIPAVAERVDEAGNMDEKKALLDA